MSDALRVLVPVGGVSVLSSYAWGYFQKDIKKSTLWGGLKGPLFTYWCLSALLTTISFIYLWWFFTFDTTLSDSDTTWLLVFYSFFLLSATLWMFATIQYKKGKWPRWGVSATLWTTAITSIGIMAVAIAAPRSTAQQVAVAGGVMMVIQHLCWDAIVWNETFSTKIN